ncbi:HEAT repeat domain-containing protein [Alkalihalobacterium chitinilyticum]|uniref:HEAT repeat domain-containing protein n=1 Tax=Alkalihalobacterium chitinilyticum TaxID=2980103 RepID=A0ABT5VKP8_9BACI|nr:HEAT repeat domain-containing protein [Alkalihalobacterium chitinilyticum]MDE5416021.1 HEAT repeat domain-containing protein [Alkalihalobacterium chitinilyticum]
MGYYDLTKEERVQFYNSMKDEILIDITENNLQYIPMYSSNSDTYIRKNTYLILGRLYDTNPSFQNRIIQILRELMKSENEKVRQTAVNGLGEIGKKDAGMVLECFETALVDQHHSVRNAVIGSLKKMGQANPKPILSFAKKHLHHPEAEIRREVIHGIELRGRTHPEEVLPLLEEVQFEKVKRVKNMVIHVFGQISYKKGCLEKVVSALLKWENKELVNEALVEILDVHVRYQDFSDKTYQKAKEYIDSHFNLY